MPKCDLQRYWNLTSASMFSWKFATYFQNNFCYEHLWVAASVNWYRKPENVDNWRFSETVETENTKD